MEPRPMPPQPNAPQPGQPGQPGNAPGPTPQSAYYSPQPVAYDQNGNPLYAQPQYVYMARPVQPMPEYVPPEIEKLHQESTKKYPHLNLSKGEYILSAVKRHPIGILKIWFIGLALIGSFMALYVVLFGGSNSDLQDMAPMAVGVLAILLVLVIGGTFVATYVYSNNSFYLTNESVIQEIQTTVFSKHEQTVSLSNIEDASYHQSGIIASLFNYGTIRLSTEGDETTYRFAYVANPKHELAVLNNAVESFKNGRSIDPRFDDQPS